jgi:REP element-mobilizing transposase RayT
LRRSAFRQITYIFCRDTALHYDKRLCEKSKEELIKEGSTRISGVAEKYWGRHFWGKSYFSAISVNVTDDITNAYINNHIDGHLTENESNISLE